MRKVCLRLLVTDLDGTLIGHRDDRSIHPAFKEFIDHVRSDHQLRWLICTGRRYKNFRHVTKPLERHGITPDLVVARYGRVFKRTSGGYRALPGLTLRIMHARMSGHVRGRYTLQRMYRHVATKMRGARRVLKLRERFTLRFSTEAYADAALHWIQRRVKKLPTLKVTKRNREIDVKQSPCHKGIAVRVVARHLGIPRDEVLTIIDSRNDLCMLDRRIAIHTGCPLNADEETRHRVRSLGGHLATAYTMAGVMDVTQATLNGTVCSDLPPEPEAMPYRRRSSGRSSRSRDRRQLRRSYALRGAVLFITLIVLASFDLLPFSRIIMQPVQLLFRLIVRIWMCFQ